MYAKEHSAHIVLPQKKSEISYAPYQATSSKKQQKKRGIHPNDKAPPFSGKTPAAPATKGFRQFLHNQKDK